MSQIIKNSKLSDKILKLYFKEGKSIKQIEEILDQDGCPLVGGEIFEIIKESRQISPDTKEEVEKHVLNILDELHEELGMIKDRREHIQNDKTWIHISHLLNEIRMNYAKLSGQLIQADKVINQTLNITQINQHFETKLLELADKGEIELKSNKLIDMYKKAKKK